MVLKFNKDKYKSTQGKNIMSTKIKEEQLKEVVLEPSILNDKLLWTPVKKRKERAVKKETKKIGFEVVREEEFVKFETVFDTVLKPQIPKRGTSKSAGYDFHTPIDFTLEPGNQIIIPTMIKAYMGYDQVLTMHIRSSIGIKKNVILTNCTGIIDSDYYSNEDNDGNICLALLNLGNETVHFRTGDRIAQGIFMKYLITDDDKSDLTRKGGIGSTN